MNNPQTVEKQDLAAEAPFTGVIRLKAERVEEKLVLDREGGVKVAFSLELTADSTQPLTVELAEPRVTIVLHGAQVDAELAV